MANYTITLTATEKKAMETIIIDIDDWITNAATNRARIAKEKIISDLEKKESGEEEIVEKKKEEKKEEVIEEKSKLHESHSDSEIPNTNCSTNIVVF